MLNHVQAELCSHVPFMASDCSSDLSICCTFLCSAELSESTAESSELTYSALLPASLYMPMSPLRADRRLVWDVKEEDIPSRALTRDFSFFTSSASRKRDSLQIRKQYAIAHISKLSRKPIL